MAFLNPLNGWLLGSWPALLPDSVASNHGVGKISGLAPAPIVEGLKESAAFFDIGDGVEIAPLPLYRSGPNAAIIIYSQSQLDTSKPGNTSILSMDEGKPAGGWALEDYVAQDGTIWLRKFQRDRTGKDHWANDKEFGLVQRFNDRPDCIVLRWLANMSSLWLNGAKIADESLGTDLRTNTSPLRVSMYRPGVGTGRAFLQGLEFFGGPVTDTEVQNAPPARAIVVTPPTPIPPPPPKIPESPLDTHDPVIRITKQYVGRYETNPRGDAPCYDFGLRERIPAPWCIYHDNGGWNNTNKPRSGPVLTYPVFIHGSPGAAVVGGMWQGKNPLRRGGPPDPYENSATILFHEGAGNNHVFGCRMNRGWDGIRFGCTPLDPPGKFSGTVEHCWFSEHCDDSIAFTNLGNGIVRNNLVDRGFVMISVTSSNAARVTHEKETLTIEDNLFYTLGVISQTHPSGGTLFKCEPESQSAIMRRNVWRLEHIGDQIPNRMWMYLGPRQTKLRESKDNVLLWTGPGGLPANFPADEKWLRANGWDLLVGPEAVAYWNKRREAWIKAHTYVPRLPAYEPQMFAGDPKV